MSPRPANQGVRLALVETAARILAEEGGDALTTRRLAAEVGTSTMALYTHFDDMAGLRRAVRLEWFVRLSKKLERVPKTRDPVADLAALGWAYFFAAVENKHMFRATVVDPLDDPGAMDIAIETWAGGAPEGAGPWQSVLAAAAAAFQVLADSVQRCSDEGRLRPGDATARALQIWMMGNGVLVACLAGFITVADATARFYEMTASLLTTFGDDPDAARASLERGRRRMERRASGGQERAGGV